MTNYKVFTDKIEVRSVKDKENPEYIVRGYASIPNQLDWYRFNKKEKSDGTFEIESFRSLFTDNAVESIERQMKSKKVFVDVEHEIASVINSKHLIEQMREEAKSKGIIIDTPIEQVLDYMKHSEIPFAKVSGFEIDDKGLFVETKLNPAFRELSENHRKYFDSVWSSLQNGFINAMSINFQTTKVKDKFIGGRRIDAIDDVDFYGISYTGQPALPENSITDVFMRSAMEFREGNKMEKVEIVETPKINVDEIKANVEKEVRAKLEKEFSEQRAKENLEREKAEQIAYTDRLKKELEEKNTRITEMEKTQRKSIVAGTNTVNRDSLVDITDFAKQLTTGEILGDAVIAQAVFGSLPEVTQKAASGGADITIKSRK